jgi:hypothetical protein
MALSSVTYTATPGQTVFPVTFHLIAAEDLVVTVDDVVKAITTDWTIDSGNLNVTFLVAMSGGEEVVLQRVTPLLDADLPVSFTDGAAITKQNMDLVVHDLNHKIQELDDGLGDVTGAQGPPGADGSPGLVWRGPWDSLTSYDAPDVVEYLGSSWVALGPSLNSPPDANPLDWDLVAQKGDDGAAGQDGAGDEMMIFMGL